MTETVETRYHPSLKLRATWLQEPLDPMGTKESTDTEANTDAKTYPPSLELQAIRLQERLDAMGTDAFADTASPYPEHTQSAEQKLPGQELDVTMMPDDELAKVAETAAHEIAERQSRARTAEIGRLQSVIDDAEGYKQVYNLNDSDIKDLVTDTKAKIAELKGDETDPGAAPKAAEATSKDEAIDPDQLRAAIKAVDSGEKKPSYEAYADKRAVLSELLGFKTAFNLNLGQIDETLGQLRTKLAEIDARIAADHATTSPATSGDGEGLFPPIPKIDRTKLNNVQPQPGNGEDDSTSLGAIPHIDRSNLNAPDNTAPATATPENDDTASETTKVARNQDFGDHVATFGERAGQALKGIYTEIRDGLQLTAGNLYYRLTSMAEQRDGEAPEKYKQRLGRTRAIGITAVAAAFLLPQIAQLGWEFRGGGNPATAAPPPEAVPGGSGPNVKPVVPQVPETGAGVDTFSPSADVLNVHDGEGLNNTMKQIGIPGRKWEETLKIAGPELVKMGEAYKDPNIGGYGLNGDGTLSKKAAQLLFDTAKNIR